MRISGFFCTEDGVGGEKANKSVDKKTMVTSNLTHPEGIYSLDIFLARFQNEKIG